MDALKTEVRFNLVQQLLQIRGVGTDIGEIIHDVETLVDYIAGPEEGKVAPILSIVGDDDPE